MGDLISISDYSPVDPILRKGDLIKIVKPEEVEEYGFCGIVLDIEKTYGPDSDAPGQAAVFSVAVPDEHEWFIIENIELSQVSRRIGKESRDLKAYEEMM